MQYFFLLVSRVFLDSLLHLWKSNHSIQNKLYLSTLFCVYTLLLPLSFVFPIRTIYVGRYSIGGIPFVHLLFQFSEIFIRQEYDTGCKDAKNIIDGGANIGMATIYFAYYFPNSQITSIEPDPHVFEILRQNIVANKLSNRVTLINSALMDKDCPSVLHFDDVPGRTTMSVIKTRASLSKSISVPGRRLSSLMHNHVDVLKLDIEGAENLVFADLMGSGVMKSISRIVMEYHHIFHDSAMVSSFGKFLTLLEKSGFTYSLDAHSLRLYPHTTQDILICAHRTES